MRVVIVERGPVWFLVVWFGDGLCFITIVHGVICILFLIYIIRNVQLLYIID